MSEKIVNKQFTFWNFTSCWKPFWFILLFLDLNISPSMSSENSNTCNKEILIFCWKKLKIIFPLINRLPVVFHFLIDCSRVLITGHKLNWKLKANPGHSFSNFETSLRKRFVIAHVAKQINDFRLQWWISRGGERALGHLYPKLTH